jgi:hypothetical protein
MGRFARLFSTALISVGLLAGFSEKGSAYQATVSGTTYNFTTITGTFTALESTLISQVWWGDLAKAQSFAAALGTNLGSTVNFGEVGPFFAYAVDPNASSGRGSFSYAAPVSYGSGVVMQTEFLKNNLGADNTWTFAIASPVPEIDGALLPQAALIAAGLFAWSRRRKVAPVAA